MAASPRIRVVASVPNLGSIASAIGGDRIDLTVLASGSQDARFVEPKLSFTVKLRSADILLINGFDLEASWIPKLTQGARNPKIILGGPGYVDCSLGIRPVDVPPYVNRAIGEIHPYGEPFYLTDPFNAEIVAAEIATALERADPSSAQLYEVGRAVFVRKLYERLFGKEFSDAMGLAKLAEESRAGTLERLLDGTSAAGVPLRSRLGGWLGKTRTVRGMSIVTYHKDFSYFARRFGVQVVDYVEPKPGIPPSKKRLRELIEKLKQKEAQVIVTRPFVEHRSTDSLAKATGVRVISLPLEVGGAPEATDYFTLMDYLTDMIVLVSGAAEQFPGTSGSAPSTIPCMIR